MSNIREEKSRSVAAGISQNRGPAENVRRRSALKNFLKARRSILSPQDIGMAAYGRRNTSGLRREEVAVRAGVSASWYTWLEQGRNIKVSSEVVNAVADALNLEGVDRAHLFLLAGLNPPPVVLGVKPDEAAQLGRLIDGIISVPMYAVDRYWNNLFANEPARALFDVGDADCNHLVNFFTGEAARYRYVNWDETAVRLVGQFRIQSARFPQDSRFHDMADQLCAMSFEFAQIWGRHEICDSTMDDVCVRLPDGRVRKFKRITLGLFERYDMRLVLHLPSES